ncbi:MAG TPA: hypothetical protein VK880_05320 [Anaerolineales bacterium]|nr:hypothetical protein [Anaerolineales bacterium]
MPAKPAKRNWDDVQTAIATAAIVTTLAMWNLFAKPAKAEQAEVAEPEEKAPYLPVMPTEPPIGLPIDVDKMPYVKVMFTQVAPQTTTNVQQPQQEKKKKRKKKDNGGGGGGGGGGGAAAPVTNTQSS